LSTAAALTLVMLLAGTSLAIAVRGPAGGPPPDPFDSDHSPRAEAFRQAWKEAEEYKAPAGVAGAEARQLTADAYERAVSLMPEATAAPALLLLEGNILGSGSPESEQPDKAIAVFQRVIREYPQNHYCVIRALNGLGNNYETKEDWAKAMEASQRILDYSLPDDANRATKELLETRKKYAQMDLERRNARLHGVIQLGDGKVVVPGVAPPDLTKYSMKGVVGSEDATPDESGPSTDAAAAVETQEKPEEAGRGSAAAPAVGPRLGWVVASIIIAGAAVAIAVRLRRSRNRKGS
jgi:hypothetical protein